MSGAVKISAVIIAKNEERNIGRCLRSLQRVADELLVVDSGSTDRTVDICQQHGARVLQHPFEGYRDQKNYATAQAIHDYVLSLDADEALSVELERSIMAVKSDWRCDGYTFNRLNYFCGDWVRHSGWYPDCKIRLFDRRRGQWVGGNIHEVVGLEPSCVEGHLSGDLLHWSYHSYTDYLRKLDPFSTMQAQCYADAGKRSSWLKLYMDPIWKFLRSYILKLGFTGGYNGLFIAHADAMATRAKYAKLRELRKSDAAKSLAAKQPQQATPGLRIAIDAKRAYFNRSGLGNYSRNLISALCQWGSNALSLFLFTPRLKGRMNLPEEQDLFVVYPKYHRFRLLQSVWRSRTSTRDVRRLRIDIYHGLSHELPWGIHRTQAKTVLTVHDLIFMRHPELFGRINAWIYTRKIRYACRVANRVVAVSTQTKNDIVELLGVEPQRIEVIPQSCNSIFRQQASAEEIAQVRIKYNLPERYMLYVGTVEQRKNILTAIKAIDEQNIDIQLVVVGRKTSYYTNEIAPYVAAHGLEQRVLFPQYVPDADMPALYQGAWAFIYPSIYEGFGIPIVEALTSGLPVITTQGGCFEETGGDACLYVPPTDVRAMGEAMRKLMSDSDLRQHLVACGREHVQRFSPERIAQQYVDLYKSL